MTIIKNKISASFTVLIFLQFLTFILFAVNSNRLETELRLRDARARITTIDTLHHLKIGDYDQQEIDVVIDNWEAAQYDRVMPTSQLLNARHTH